jgi:hypothetical protein
MPSSHATDCGAEVFLLHLYVTCVEKNADVDGVGLNGGQDAGHLRVREGVDIVSHDAELIE